MSRGLPEHTQARIVQLYLAGGRSYRAIAGQVKATKGQVAGVLWRLGASRGRPGIKHLKIFRRG